jgi:hypothetical protein
VAKKIVLGCLFFAGALALSLPGQSLAPQVANYSIDARLDTTRRTLSGREVLTWTNTSSQPAEELWFHLYWNAFANNASTFLVEDRNQGGGSAVSDFDKEDWGYARVEAFKILKDPSFEGYDLRPSLVFRHPDDGNALDRTVFSVRLPQPLPPGETIALEVRWEGKVPRPVARTGVVGDYYFIAQWFPKIGVFQDGTWNCHQYHAQSEFFADYGTYDVRLTVPAGFVVGATGRSTELARNQDGSVRHRFIQENVHDFAWAASPRFLEYHQDFRFGQDRRTEVILLLQPEHLRLKDRYLRAIMAAVKEASLLFGDYPYETVTCVDPAFNSASGGMEYPTFFAGGASFLDPEGSGDPEGVTIHEFGHNYFYGLVGSNEFENPWMDEGFTSFLESEVYDRAYGPRLYTRTYFGIPVTFKDVPIPLESSGISEVRRTAVRDIMQRFAWQFLDPASYATNSYAKAEVMLRTLKRFLGNEVFGALVKDYALTWRFRHPLPRDFYEIAARHAGQDLGYFLDPFIYGSGLCDYALAGVRTLPAPPRRGWFDGVYARGEGPAGADRALESEVVVRRLGDVRIPVDIEVDFEGGQRLRETWDGQYLWKRFLYRGPKKVVRAVVDPEFKIVADVNRTNNSWNRRPNAFAPWQWVANWLGWLQHAFEFFGVLGG